MKRGIVAVYTGSGKGKTTAALGLALRFLGHGLSVCLIQFLKARASGEQAAAKAWPRFEFQTLGLGFVRNDRDLERHRAAALKAWDRAREKLAGGYDLVVLDEVSYLFHFHFLEPSALLAALAARRAPMHVCLTGRDMPDEITRAADLATEMRELAHPWHAGTSNIKGIDY